MQKVVLFVSPEPGDAALLSRMLEPVQLCVVHAQDLSQARVQLGSHRFAVVLTEAELPDGCWKDVLHLLREFDESAELIVTHPFADSRFWAEALSLGAYDLVAQPFRACEVQRIFSNACSRSAFVRTAGVFA